MNAIGYVESSTKAQLEPYHFVIDVITEGVMMNYGN